MENKYKNNYLSFVEDFRFIVDPKIGELIHPPLFQFEEDFLNGIHNNQCSIIKKARQMHTSTLMAAYVAWKVLFHENEKVAISAIDSRMQARFIYLVKQTMEQHLKTLPDREFSKIFLINTQREFKIAHTNSSVVSIKSLNIPEDITMLVFDEVEFIEKAAEIYGKVVDMWENQGVLDKRKVIIYSTPRHEEGFFYKAWNMLLAKRFKNYYIDELTWWINPHFNKKVADKDKRNLDHLKDNIEYSWYDEMCKVFGGDEEKIAQQLRCEFTKSQKPKENKSVVMNFRIDRELQKEIMKKYFLEPTEEAGKLFNFSAYVRTLIEKDLKAQ